MLLFIRAFAVIMRSKGSRVQLIFKAMLIISLKFLLQIFRSICSERSVPDSKFPEVLNSATIARIPAIETN